MRDFAGETEGSRRWLRSGKLRTAITVVCSLALLLTLSCKREGETGRSRAALSDVPGAAASLPAPAPPEPPVHSSACEHLHLLETYRAAGVLNEKDPLKPELNLHVDLHGADCGAPDGYGHDMTLTLELAAEGKSCRLVAAHAEAKAWGEFEPNSEKSWKNAFVPAKPYDLANRGTELDGVELRDEKRKEALLLLVDNYWFFEKAPTDRKLTPQLAPEREKPGTSYGYTSSASSHWRSTYYVAPDPFWYETEGFVATGEQLDEFNRWATRWDLRFVLEALTQQAFGLGPKDTVEVKQQNDSAATVHVVQMDSYHRTNSYVRELKFSRKSCTACSGGYSGWWLWAARGDWDCHEEDQSACSKKLAKR